MKTYRDFVSSLLHEKSLSPSDIDSLINRAKDSVRDIIQNKNRDPSDRKQGREVLQWIQGVQRTWTRKKSLHPNAINGLMRIVAGTSSSNLKVGVSVLRVGKLKETEESLITTKISYIMLLYMIIIYGHFLLSFHPLLT